VVNQRTITGPKTRPIDSVPRRWTAKSPIRIATVMGTTAGLKVSVATSSPSTAERTPLRLGALGQQGEQREDAPLPLVVRAHDEGEVLDADDREHAPEHQREEAEHVGGRRLDAVSAVDTLLQRVERARADVPEDDAERGEREGAEPSVSV
jgi:hypothetical protein